MKLLHQGKTEPDDQYSASITQFAVFQIEASDLDESPVMWTGNETHPEGEMKQAQENEFLCQKAVGMIDWNPYYKGPGQDFARPAYAQYVDGLIIVTREVGWDV